MVAPIISFSSQLTTELLTWRNPGGEESAWLDPNTPQESAWNPLFWGRVVTTEIGCSLLIVVATVETVAYAVLIVMPGEHQWGKKLQSSAFTVYWNLGNVVGFNLFCKNVFTNESLARFSFVHRERGQRFDLLFKLVILTCIELACFGVPQQQLLPMGLLMSRAILKIVCVDLVRNVSGRLLFRQEDSAYLMQWRQEHRYVYLREEEDNYRVTFFTIRGLVSLPVVIGYSILKILALVIVEIARAILRKHREVNVTKEGATFLKEHFLREGAVDAPSQEMIREGHEDSFEFVIARTVYLYGWGEKKADALPSFLKSETLSKIQELRLHPVGVAESVAVEQILRSCEAFKGMQGNEALNQLKGIAYGELQASLFITKCFARALS